MYVGPTHRTDLHAHHAVQLSFALEGDFLLCPSLDAPWRRYRAAGVASDCPHQFDGCGNRIMMVYLDPESREARALAPLDGSRIYVLPTEPALRFLPRLCVALQNPSSDDLASAARELAAVLAGAETHPRAPDVRIERALDMLRASPQRRTTLSEAAAAVHLSPSRFAHLFTSETGLPLRRYILWLRLVQALREISTGATLTRAAYAAGFADSAHLTRTFRRMLGVAPSALRAE
jgi:AraC family transcriptional regulator